MKKRIFRSMNLVVLFVLLITMVLFSAVQYQQNLGRMKTEVRYESAYIEEAYELLGLPYLDRLERGNEESRVTLIDSDGAVLYDSMKDYVEFENHQNRKEFRDALDQGSGESIRHSASLDEETYYYAVRLSDGNVLRVSSTTDSVLLTMRNSIPMLLIIGLLSFLLSFVLAKRQSESLMEPIVSLDLESPAPKLPYEELAPLLARIQEQRQQIESAVLEEQSRQQEFHAITSNMREGLVMINTESRVLFINRACMKLFDCKPELCVGEHLHTVSRIQDFLDVASSALAGKGSECVFPYVNHMYQVYANPVFSEEQPDNLAIVGAVLLIMDVTEAQRAQQVRRDFVANVSHELKTPLMTISGYAEIIKNNIARPEDIPVFSGRIYQEAKRLTTLVQDIIKLSELDEEGMERTRTVVDLKTLAEDILDYLKPEIDKKQIAVHVQGDSFYVFGIQNILEEMVYNLCDNAIKYNRVAGSLVLTFAKEPNGHSLTVEDTGIGIDAAEQERIFERFYRVDKSRSRESGGTGLGLSIVKHAAILHHAQIFVESTPGTGTKMRVVFPDNMQA
ncbi:MAG: ATP-binding protein [Lachnospiraceae bacterium]